MRLYAPVNQAQILQLEQAGFLDVKEGLPLYSPTLWKLHPAQQEGDLFVEVEDTSPNLHLEMRPGWRQMQQPVLTGRLERKDVLQIVDTVPFAQTCILMNTSMIDESWCAPTLAKYIHPQDRVCVVAFSFFDDTKNLKDWQKQYAPGQGIWYRANTDVFFPFGLRKEQITWCNYFTDTPVQLAQAICSSSILLFTGGAPDLMMQRLKEKKLVRYLKNFSGLILGYSAGAMVQLETYHITPDEDYPDFSWQKGLGYIQGMDIEVHYKASRHQKKYIEQAMEESGMPVYAIYEKGGLVVKNHKPVEFFGQVDVYDVL